MINLVVAFLGCTIAAIDRRSQFFKSIDVLLYVGWNIIPSGGMIVYHFGNMRLILMNAIVDIRIFISHFTEHCKL